MVKSRGYPKTPPPRFKVGDTVSFLFGNGTVTGRVVEDRGGLGIGGRRLYGIRFEINLGDETYTEMPEADLTAGPADRASGRPRSTSMARSRSCPKTPPPRFKIGETVSFAFGSGTATGRIVEDRGGLGIGGRRLYGIRFEINPGDERYVEVPEEELTAGPADRASRKHNR